MSNDLTILSNTFANVTLLEMRQDSQRFPRVGNVPREVAVQEMTKIVTQAFLYKGMNADVQSIQFISVSLVDELRNDLDHMGTKNISFAEVSRIIKRAILQDEIYGISVATLYKVIMDYIKGEGHILQQKVKDSKKDQMDKSMDAMVSVYAAQMIKKK